MSNLCAMIATPGAVGLRVADAFILLLRDACNRESPHELDVVRRRDFEGEIRDVKVFPQRWAQRLERAFEGGAFERMEPSEIARRILTTDAPADIAPADREATGA